MLRVAVPNKGSLSDPAVQMLHEAGYRQRAARHELALIDQENDTEFFFLRPRDIATYVGAGQLEVGITGRDLLLDGQSDAEEVLALGFGQSTFHYAAVPGTASDPRDFAGKRIATSYPGIVRRDLEQRGVEAGQRHVAVVPEVEEQREDHEQVPLHRDPERERGRDVRVEDDHPDHGDRPDEAAARQQQHQRQPELDRRPEVRAQAADTLTELARLSRELHKTYVRRSLRAILNGDR